MLIPSDLPTMLAPAQDSSQRSSPPPAPHACSPSGERTHGLRPIPEPRCAPPQDTTRPSSRKMRDSRSALRPTGAGGLHFACTLFHRPRSCAPLPVLPPLQHFSARLATPRGLAHTFAELPTYRLLHLACARPFHSLARADVFLNVVLLFTCSSGSLSNSFPLLCSPDPRRPDPLLLRHPSLLRPRFLQAPGVLFVINQRLPQSRATPHRLPANPASPSFFFTHPSHDPLRPPLGLLGRESEAVCNGRGSLQANIRSPIGGASRTLLEEGLALRAKGEQHPQPRDVHAGALA